MKLMLCTGTPTVNDPVENASQIDLCTVRACPPKPAQFKDEDQKVEWEEEAEAYRGGLTTRVKGIRSLYARCDLVGGKFVSLEGVFNNYNYEPLDTHVTH